MDPLMRRSEFRGSRVAISREFYAITQRFRLDARDLPHAAIATNCRMLASQIATNNIENPDGRDTQMRLNHLEWFAEVMVSFDLLLTSEAEQQWFRDSAAALLTQEEMARPEVAARRDFAPALADFLRFVLTLCSFCRGMPEADWDSRTSQRVAEAIREHNVRGLHDLLIAFVQNRGGLPRR